MKDEIKEILERLEKYGQLTPDAIDDLHYIKDYITNLQEEKEDYKSINKKAIEYIKQQDMKYYGAVVNTKMDCILTILNGGENND